MGSLSEGKGKNYGRKGGQGSDKPVRITPFDRREARANIQDPSKTNNPADIVRRFFNVKDEPGTVSSNVSRDELLKRLESQTNQRLSKSAQAAADIADVEPDAARIRNQAGEVAQRSRETRPPQRRPLADTTKGGPVRTMKLGDPGAPSKEAARTLQRMTTADPTTTARLQSNLRKGDTAPKLEPTPAAPKPEPIKQSDVSKRAARFRQSFGTPTGADPFTGKPTYKPLEALTDLPKGKGGTTPSPEAYSKVKVGDLDVKRFVRTTGPQGVPTDKGAENFLLNRETKGALGGRNARQISPEQGKAALERVKGFMADPKEVAKVKGQIKQEVGGRRAQLETPPSRPSRSTAAATGSTTARPSAPSLTTTTLRPSRPSTTSGPRPSGPAPTSTTTKVRQALKLAIPEQPPAPKPQFGSPVTTKSLPARSTAPASSPDLSKTQRVQSRPQSTAGQNLEFTKSKSGSFTYKPQVSAPSAQPQAPTPEWTRTTRAQLPEPAAPTRRRASGDAGPSSRLSSAPRPPSTELRPQPAARRQNILPDLGSGSTTIRSGQSTTIKPRTATPKQQRPGSGLGTGLTWGAFNAADAYTTAKAQGQSDEYARNLAIARGTSTAAGSVVTTKVLQSLLGRVPGGKQVASFAGPVLGSYIGDTVGAFGAGASKSDKEWMAKANRAVQPGVLSQNAQSKAGGRAVVRDAQGRERVGYASKLTGSDGVTRTVYKHANSPASLAYTSSNPLERVGRRTADAGIPWVSDFLKKRYAASDEAVRRANVATQRSRAGNK